MNRRTTHTLFLTIFTSFVLGISSCGNEHTHKYSKDWSYDDEYHWHAAICGHDLKKDYEPHTWGEWIIDDEPTVEQDGVKHHVCEVCQHSVSESIPFNQVDATRVYLSSDVKKSFVGVGSTKTLNPIVFPNDARKDLKYISEDPNVLTIDDATGILTGVSQGTSLITCYNDNNGNGVLDESEPRSFASYQVVNKNPAYSVSINQSSYEISVGETITVNPTANGFTPSGTSPWGSYAYKSPYIYTYGTSIKGIKPGEADVVIYTTPAGESISYDTTIHVTVIDRSDSSGKRANSIEFDRKVKVLNVGDTFVPSYTISPVDSVDTNVTFSRSNSNIVMNDGVFTATKAGTCTLTVKTPNNKISRMRVVIKDPTAEYEDLYKGYYGDLTWENGDDLRSKLHDIISTDVTHLRYTDNWESNINADSLRTDNTKVNVLYRDEPIGNNDHGTTAGKWQREHCFAASLMTGISTGDAVVTKGRATDFHNLYAAFGSGNGSRGNKNFGFADAESLRYKTPENGGSYVFDDNNFEPANIDKGKVARAIFYMSVMYDDFEDLVTSDGKQFKALPLEIVENVIPYNSISYADFSDTSCAQMVSFAQKYVDIVRALNPEIEDETELLNKAYSYYMTYNNPSAIGNLSTLLMWNSYAVDEQEMQHNNSVYAFNASTGGGIQGNRNPFVDYPELAEYAFGSLRNKAGSLSNLKPAVKDLDIEIPDKPRKPDTTDDVAFSSCNYQFETSSKPQDLVVDGVATFGSLSWNYSTENTGVALGSSNGLKIGTASASAGMVTFETQNSLSDIEAVVLKIYCPKDLSYTYDLYIGDELVKYDVSLLQNPSAITEYGNLFETSKTGKVKIVLKNLTSYISLKGIAIKYSA